MSPDIPVRLVRETCSACEGRGWVPHYDHKGQRQGNVTCPSCSGNGYVWVTKPLE